MHKAILFGLICLLVPAASPAETPPDGWIVFASNRQDSRHEIYLMKADGTNLSRLTAIGAKSPTWSPDGRWIAYRTEPAGRTRVMRWDKSEDKEIFAGEPLFFMHDNSGLVCMVNDDLHLVDPDSGSSQYLFRKDDFSHMAGMSWYPSGISRNGRWLVTWTDRYRGGYTGSNGTFDSYHCAVILDIQNKGDIFFFGGGCEPATPPSGGMFYHVCGDCPTHPDVYRMDVADRQTRSSYQAEIAYADNDWGHEYFPRVSTDGVWLTYGATTDGCHDHDTCDYDVFVHRLGAGNGNRERVTHDPNNDQWPHMYVGNLWGVEPPRLAQIEVTPASSTIIPGGNIALTAALRDQFDAPFAAVVSWSASGGGTLSPDTSTDAVSNHTTTFTSDGSRGNFTVTAAAEGVQGTAGVSVQDPSDEEPAGQDAGGADDGGAADDGGPTDDGGPAGDRGEDSGSQPTDGEKEIVVEGGCSGCGSAGPGGLLLTILIPFARPRRRGPGARPE